MTRKRVRLIVVGTGQMAANHVRAFQMDPHVDVIAGVDIDANRAKEFCELHGIPNAFDSLDEAISWGEFDAATDVTPDRAHHPTTMKLLAARKHVLCEKPLAENYFLAEEMTRAAEAANVVNMVNLTYRNVPALQKARALIAAGEIGEIRHVEASYRQSWLVGNTWGDWRDSPTWLWRLSQAHGSKGVLGDVGIHILDFATYAIGMQPVSLQCRLKTFDKVVGNRIGDYVLDANDSAVMSLSFPNGALGVIHASRFITGYLNTLRLGVYGTQGGLEIDHGSASTILRVCSGNDVNQQAWREVISDPVNTNYQKFIGAIVSGVHDEPSFHHAACLQRFLDLCAESSEGTLPADVNG